MTNYLIFVDTNILLDFYRTGWESGLSVLKRFDRMHDRLITTYQVEMEFKKNRQRVIHDTLENLKRQEKFQTAVFLQETQAFAVLNRSVNESNKQIGRLRDRLAKVLANPTRNDPVYKVVQRFFKNDSSLNLKREMPERRQLKRAAFRRFILGYPPRKPDDTSMGDALNWEWIVHVAQQNPGKHIAIVSRDSDYGVKIKDKSHMNDWLIQEFRDRVSKKRSCELFNRLSPAFELAGMRVSKKAEKEEKEFAQKRSVVPRPGTGRVFFSPTYKLGQRGQFFQDLWSQSQLTNPLLPLEEDEEADEDAS